MANEIDKEKDNYITVEMLNCNLCPVYENCFSSYVKAKDTETFEKEVRKIQVQKDSHIFNTGQAAENMYMLISGEVKLVKEDDIPYPVTMYIAHEGEFFGIGALIKQKYITTASTLSESTICVFSKYLVDEILRKSCDSNQLIVKALFLQIRNISDYSITMIAGTSLAKVAKALLMLMDKDKKIYVTKEEIALMISSTRETVSRSISRFRRRDFIEIDGKIITVIDTKALENASKDSKRK